MTPASDGTARYLQLAVLVLIGGCVYPLVYLRTNYEISMTEAFGISIGELAGCYAMLGAMFVATYLPSGWLADRISTRWLITFSLVASGLLGLWFATLPPLADLRIIFVGWGITTGLTFWSALIKAVSVLARPSEQGRFFGILDGGRGLVEAALATVAVALFAHALETQGRGVGESLRQVIYFYTACLLLMAPVAFLMVDDVKPEGGGAVRQNLLADLGLVLGKKEIWLCAFCILCGYQLVWSTGSFSAFLQQTHGMSAVTVGVITVALLWMRPIGAVSAGLAGDMTRRELVLAGLFAAAALSLVSILAAPVGSSAAFMLGVVLVIGLVTYAVRGIYWSTLESCDVPVRVKGLAIGAISLLGYSPDLYLPLIYGSLLEAFPGRTGFAIYFGGIAGMGLMGGVAAWRLYLLANRREGLLSGEQPPLHGV
jgi:hypothetical protein